MILRFEVAIWLILCLTQCQGQPQQLFYAGKQDLPTLLDNWDMKDMRSSYHGTHMKLIRDASNDVRVLLDQLRNTIANDKNQTVVAKAKASQKYYQEVMSMLVVNSERNMDSSGGSGKQRIRQCYSILTTMLNSRLDVQRYYKIRYMYAWTLHFEIGYLSHEILRHYTMAIDLFHLVYTRFNDHRLDDHTPPRYMLYMYSAILHECKMIIHFCHMIQEVEKKYSNSDDQTKLWRETPGSTEQLINAQNKEREANAKAWASYNAELERARADKMRALKRKNKKALEQFKGALSGLDKEKGIKKVSGAGFGAGGTKGMKQGKGDNPIGKWRPADYFYASVDASVQKKSKYPHIYGWSIENWGGYWD